MQRQLTTTALLLLCLLELCSSLSCYVDINGIKRPDDEEEKVDVNRFKTLNCSFANPGNIEKVTITPSPRKDTISFK